MTGSEYFEYLQSFDYLLAQAEINPPSEVDVCQLRRFKVAIENARPQLEKMKDPEKFFKRSKVVKPNQVPTFS